MLRWRLPKERLGLVTRMAAGPSSRWWLWSGRVRSRRTGGIRKRAVAWPQQLRGNSAFRATLDESQPVLEIESGKHARRLPDAEMVYDRFGEHGTKVGRNLEVAPFI